jgi:malonate transporter and related proteins
VTASVSVRPRFGEGRSASLLVAANDMLTLLVQFMPILAVVGLGVLAERLRLLPTGALTALNEFVYWFAFPALLFAGAATSLDAMAANLSFLGTFVGILVALEISTALVSGWRSGDRAQGVVDGLTVSCPNASYLGIPLVALLHGESGKAHAIVAATSNALLFAVTALVAAVVAKPGTGAWARSLQAAVKNPIVVAPVVGIMAGFAHVRSDGVLLKTCALLGSASGPCALFALGLYVGQQRLRAPSLRVGALVFVRLLVAPLVAALAVRTFIHLSPVAQSVLILELGLPAAVAVFVLSQRYLPNDRSASDAIVLSTCLFPLTLPLTLVVTR